MANICLKTILYSGTSYAVGASIVIEDEKEQERLLSLGAIQNSDHAETDTVKDIALPAVGGGEKSGDDNLPNTDEEVIGTVDDIVEILESMQLDDEPLSEKPKIDAVRDNAAGITILNDNFQEAWTLYHENQE